MSGSPVHHQLPEFAQTHVHRVGDRVSDAIQPSHPLLSPSPPAFNLFQRQSHEVYRQDNLGGLKLMKFTWVPDSSDNELECHFIPKYLSAS